MQFGFESGRNPIMAKMKAPPVVSDINVTPMVDVMLVLLIIFMVITPMLSKSIPVDLVKTHNPVKMKEADKEDAVVVAVTRDSRIFLSPGNNQISLDNLASKVADLQTNRSDKTVYIKADARAKYETVENVVDTLRTDKVENLGLLTEEIQDRNRRNSEL
jgi:biopolymer transport protein ExbD/biopolymer transport protein TolR